MNTKKVAELEKAIANKINELGMERDYGNTPDIVLARAAVQFLNVFGSNKAWSDHLMHSQTGGLEDPNNATAN